MFVNKDSVIINDVSMGKYLLQADYGDSRLWGSGSGRDLAW